MPNTVRRPDDDRRRREAQRRRQREEAERREQIRISRDHRQRTTQMERQSLMGPMDLPFLLLTLLLTGVGLVMVFSASFPSAYYETGDGWQISQSLIAIGSGGLLGVGLGKSRQKFLYLPEEHNDCIFAVVCEELGLIGACVVMLLFALLILRGFWIALHAKDRFGTLMVVGIMTLISLQTFLNIAVVTGLIPATGISLPFFSYGGTALALQLFEMGIVLSVSRQIPAPRNG